MNATAEGPVRVLLPEGFTTPVEANLAKDAEFVCRADIKTRVLCREQDGRMVYSVGEGEPLIRLASVKGPVVIDNPAEPFQEAMQCVTLKPRQPIF